MRWLAIAVFLIANQAYAQDLTTVRSGEHATFTRLVIDTPPPDEWSAIQEDRTVTINLPDIGNLSLDTIFDRIPRTRLLNISVAGDDLILRLGCNCPVQVFPQVDRNLVIDIRDTGSEPAVEASDLSQAVTVTDDSASRMFPPEPPATPEIFSQPDLNDVRERLVEQLTRAADQGLLKLSEDAPNTQDVVEEPAPEPEREPEAPLEDVGVPELASTPNVDIRTAFDTPTRDYPADDPGCNAPVPQTFATLQEQYSTYVSNRTTLYGEFDALNERALRDTIEQAIGLGLGAESLAILVHHKGILRAEATYTDMARIVDGMEPGIALLTHVECPGALGLWARLANDEAFLARRHVDGDLATLGTFPPEHRILIAQRVAEKWLELSLLASAQRALDFANRSGIPASREMQLTASRIAQRRRDVQTARTGFEALAAGTDLVGHHARAHLIEIELNDDITVDRGAELDLAATAFQMRGTPLGRKAIRLLASIRARDGALSQSLQLLTASADREPEMAEIWRRVAADLIESTAPGNPDYARAVLHHANFLPEGVAGDAARISAARGLLTLGLPSDAIEMASPAHLRGNDSASEIIASANRVTPRPEPTRPNATELAPRVEDPVTLAAARDLLESGGSLRSATLELLRPSAETLD
ncbi:hypothetical protein [Pontivivens nitratireducens]|uniref:hypothetical protein n=1 Tax=Pontivivens nitratireducens TaxID=2758038 RepID=UPI001639BE30|nr:hypothetical protein [Pontibrevibacter nitratireducens]